MMKKISLLGSTGSIGTSTLDVVRRNPDRLQVVAMACGRNFERALEQAREFCPRLIGVSREEDAKRLRAELGRDIEVVWGEEGAVGVATHSEADIVVSAIVGAAGLKPTYAAILAKKDIALANK